MFHQLLQAVQDIARHTAPEWYRPWTDWGLVLGTVALAIFTARLFRATADLAKTTSQLAADTVGASILADIHHQESQAPLVVWDGARIIEFDHANTPNSRISVIGYVRNVGSGPALNVRIRIHFDQGEPLNLPSGTFAVGDRVPERELRAGYAQAPMYQSMLAFRAPTLVEFAYSTAYGRDRQVTYSSAKRVDASFRYFFETEVVDLNRDERLALLTVRPER